LDLAVQVNSLRKSIREKDQIIETQASIINKQNGKGEKSNFSNDPYRKNEIRPYNTLQNSPTVVASRFQTLDITDKKFSPFASEEQADIFSNVFVPCENVFAPSDNVFIPSDNLFASSDNVFNPSDPSVWGNQDDVQCFNMQILPGTNVDATNKSFSESDLPHLEYVRHIWSPITNEARMIKVNVNFLKYSQTALFANMSKITAILHFRTLMNIMICEHLSKILSIKL
jgi:hypothetical protein